jgi:hypothetical protein
LVEFLPARARTNDDGLAFIAVWVRKGAAPGLLRVRFDLTEFDAGGAKPSPLGVDWTLPVASTVDRDGESRVKCWLVSGQGQIAVPGKPLAAYLRFQTKYYVSLQTTQPEDKLTLKRGTPQASWIDPVTKLQTLQFSPETQGDEMWVYVELLGAAPLPRLIGACSAQNNDTTWTT